MTPSKPSPARRQKVQSAEVGTEVLKALARLGPSTSLSHLALLAGMPASKAHRYLKALIAGGFAEQDPSTGRYRLGPEALYVGLAALGQISLVGAAATPIAALNTAINETTFLAVWGNKGPTVIQVTESIRSITVLTRVGSVLPLLTSATGLAFLTYLPAAATAEVGRRDMADLVAAGNPNADWVLVKERVAAIRQRGLSIVQGLYFPGVDAIAAPIFGVGGELEGVLTALGSTSGFDISITAEAVRDAAAQISDRIGYRADRTASVDGRKR